eukprot:CCRYP_003729-RA/>CCRYP_003729-RA protein AED:0.00 eAED:0.00 QI:11/1/1/1/0/0/2/123/40
MYGILSNKSNKYIDNNARLAIMNELHMTQFDGVLTGSPVV